MEMRESDYMREAGLRDLKKEYMDLKRAAEILQQHHNINESSKMEQKAKIIATEISKIDPNFIKELDSKIEASAPAWPVDKLNKVDLAILRLAVYELLYESTIPQKVVIDEAVELAKEFGSENSYGFVNGVLGDILENLKEDDK